MDSSSFLSVRNFTLCLDIFKKYMQDQYNISNIHEFVGETEIKLQLFSIMDRLNKSAGPNSSVKQLNNLAIQELRDQFLQTHNVIANRKPHVKQLDREKAIYGDRPMMEVQLKPKPTSFKKEDVERRFESIMNERKENKVVEPTKPQLAPIIENAISEEDFKAKLSSLEKARADYFESSVDIAALNSRADHDPKAFYQNIQNKVSEQQAQVENQTALWQKDRINYETTRQKELIESPANNILKRNFIIINGYDRNWVTYPQRFKFSIDWSDMSKAYKNIREISFNRLIVPMEVYLRDSERPMLKSTFVNPFGMAFQYLTLNIDELNDNYDGISQMNRRAFTTFIYDNEYKAPNGRGYVILCPMQKERKTFFPAHLSTLQRMTMTIARPNGTLFNNSMDDYMMLKVEYESYNMLYLKIVLDKYFDKNEFYLGDTIFVRNYTMPPNYSTYPSTSPEYIEYTTNRDAYDKIMAFINRQEGHEIVQLGEPNEHGFYRNFFIYAPGVLDQTCGKIIVDSYLTTQIQNFNNLTNLACCTAPSPVGNIINTSLQCVLAMNVVTSVGNASYVIESSNI